MFKFYMPFGIMFKEPLMDDADCTDENCPLCILWKSFEVTV